MFIIPENHEKLAGLGRYSTLPNYPKILLAKDASENTKYLISGLLYNIKVIKINRIGNTDFVTSVTVDSEAEPFRKVQISGDTELIPYSDEWHKWSPKVQVKAEKLMSKVDHKKLQEKKPSRASIIDREIYLSMQKNQIPVWEDIAKKVKENGAAKENVDNKHIIAQAKSRYKWYSVDSIPNPIAKELVN